MSNANKTRFAKRKSCSRVLQRRHCLLRDLLRIFVLFGPFANNVLDLNGVSPMTSIRYVTQYVCKLYIYIYLYTYIYIYIWINHTKVVSAESYGVPAKRYRLRWNGTPVLLAKTPIMSFRSSANTLDENRTYARSKNEANSPTSFSKLSKKHY